ncbi:MAG: ArnT family glycosyltransferase, partial [Candidatus Rokuibacteriota bacterium]
MTRDRLLLVIVGLGVLLRGLYLLTPFLDSDRAVVGLMARHILQGELPVFFWGQPYGGTLEAHLAAVLFYLFGASRLTLALSPFLFSLAFLALTYRLGCELFDRATGRVALLLVAVAPPTLVSHSVTTWGHYISHLALGSLVLLLAFRTARAPDPPRRLLFVLGFAAGLAWYNSPQSVHYLVAAGLFVLLQRPRLLARPEPWLVVPAFGLGSLPLWLYNLGAPAVSTFGAVSARGSRGDLGDSLTRFFVDKVPDLLGASVERAGPGLVLGVGVLALHALALGHLLRRIRLPGSRLLLLLLVVTSVIVVVGYNRGSATRYLLPLYSAVPIMVAAFVETLRRRSAPAFAVALGCLLAANLAANVAAADVFDERKLALYLGRQARDARLVEFLRRDGLTRVYVLDFWDSYRLTFEAGEQVVFAEPRPSYYAPYTRMVDAAPRYGYVIRRAAEARIFDESLRSLGGAFRRREVLGYSVFEGFQTAAGSRMGGVADLG